MYNVQLKKKTARGIGGLVFYELTTKKKNRTRIRQIKRIDADKKKSFRHRLMLMDAEYEMILTQRTRRTQEEGRDF